MALPAPQSRMLARLRTPGFAGYNLAWSPFYPDRLAVAAAANYGLVGNGRVFVVNSRPGAPSTPGGEPGMAVERAFDTQDGLYDVAWSEVHENQLVTGSGDGSLKLWDITLADHPIRMWSEHQREVFSVDWNNLKKDVFSSSSWDASVRVWHPERPQSILNLTSHTACVYGAAWSPHNADLLASASGDGHLRLFDVRVGDGPQSPVATVPVGGEVLTLDWNKYRPMTIATGSTDRGIKVWDLRAAASRAAAVAPGPAPARAMMGGECSAVLMGHEYAIRRVAWSPHSASVLASASYDMSARIWDADLGAAINAGPRVGAQNAQRARHDVHTEFVVGLGWSLFSEGVLASCAWDCETHLWAAG